MRRDISRLESQAFDLAIVGGGIHGAWLAMRASRAGYRVALIEQDDFGGATSANSLKILHGGLRYLQHLDVARMRSSIRSRREFARLFPHLVRPLRCVMPLRATGIRSPWILGPALLANDLISADRNLGVESPAQVPRGRLVGAGACARYVGSLTDVRAPAAALWWDAIVSDTSRIVLETLMLAARAGAVVANRVQAQEYLLEASSIRGLLAVDRVTGHELRITASTVVDATGPWAGRWARNHTVPAGRLPSAWLGAINIVLGRCLGTEAAVALSSVSLASDRSSLLRRHTRELFFVPWSGLTMVGTHYHPVPDLRAASGPPAAVVEEFVEEIRKVAPRAGISLADVAHVHWGLMPAEAQDASVPSKSPVLLAGREDTGAHGLVVVIGEKFTSAPMLAETVLGRVRRELGRAGPRAPAPTGARRSDLAPGSPESPGGAPAGLPADASERLASRYGDGWHAVALLGIERPEWLLPIHPGVPVRGVEVIHAIRQEMALTLEDVVLRRVGLSDTGHPGEALLRSCAGIAALEYGWTEGETDRAVQDLDQRLARSLAGLGQRSSVGPAAATSG
jgi:glycerol-3-phosphate dehydrogenase